MAYINQPREGKAPPRRLCQIEIDEMGTVLWMDPESSHWLWYFLVPAGRRYVWRLNIGFVVASEEAWSGDATGG